jgi:hypothetical protein
MPRPAAPPALGSAALSPCGRYRWWLERVWAPRRPRLLFIGLNPSRADGRRDDATLRRLLGFADRWGYGALEVLNLFARISPSPALLQRAADPVGPGNDAWIRARLAASPEAPLWLGWGQRGGWRQRDRQVGPLLEGRRCLALGRGAAGQPRHPLYLPADAQPETWIWRQPHRLGHPEGGSAPVDASPPCRALPVAMRFTCT